MILRSLKTVSYTPPAGGNLDLFVNCAITDDESWHWKYFWTQTVGTGTPVTTNGFERSESAYVTRDASASAGQTVLRAIYAYVATKSINLNINLEADAAGINTTLIARLYSPNGTTVETFHSSNSDSFSGTITLPATVCPKILWLGAASQPSGVSPLPATSCEITTRH